MRESLISVIIPAYNSEEYIRRAIDSVLNQSYKNIEIIVIDDGSTDNTAQIVKTYTSKVTYIYQENSGVAVARSNGIKLSKGEYVAFLDSDDYVLSKMYAKLIENVQAHNAEFGCCNIYYENESGIRRKVFNNSSVTINLKQKKGLNKSFKIVGNSSCNKLFKRKLILNLKFPKIKRGEDALFVLEALLNTQKMVYIQEPLYVYFQNSLSVTKSGVDVDVIENYIHTFKEKRKLVKKYNYESELLPTITDHFYKYFLMYTNHIRKVSDKTKKSILWEKWLNANNKDFLKDTSLKYLTFFSTNINWIYFGGMLITGKFINPVLVRIKNINYYFRQKLA